MSTLNDDVLLQIMMLLPDIESLRTLKAVSADWAQLTRRVMTSSEWQANNISLHQLLREGSPTERQVISLLHERPELARERNARGLLPLQYAASHRKHTEIVDVLRGATRLLVPGAVPAVQAGPRMLRLKAVRTRESTAPILA